MADFMDFKVEEISSTEEEELPKEINTDKKRVKKLEDVNVEDDSSDEEDNEVREIMKNLTDDEESDSDDSRKRKISDDEEDDYSLEDDDYDLLEENLGSNFKRNKCKRLKKIESSSDEEDEENQKKTDMEICTPDKNHEHQKLRDEEDGDYSESNNFIVDCFDRSTTEKLNIGEPIFHDTALQEAQKMFGVDFNLSNNREDDEQDEKPPNKSILETYEPSELRRNFFTDVDRRIRRADIPERIQLRDIPITTVPKESNELNEEADWIYQQAFSKHTLSTQENLPKDPQTIPKIRKTLDFLRNQHLEVPFIAFYRKEYIQPELNINDLWRIHKFDEQWCQLKEDKENLLSRIQNLRKEQDLQIPKTEYAGAIKDSDIEFLKSVQTFDELQDVNKHLNLYHWKDIKDLQAKESRRYPSSYDTYAMIKKAGLDGLVNKFGLTPQKFAENLRDNYQRHEVEQEACSVEEIARQYVCSKFPTESDVLQAAESMVALQISREPIVKRCVREVFFKRATITVRPTQYGVTAIDEDHNCYSMKRLRNKPVKNLTGDQFLKLHLAQEQKLLTVTINDTIKGNTGNWFIDEVKQFYVRNEFGKKVQDWNTLRGKCVEGAFTKYIFPDLKKELENILLTEAKESIVKSCCKKLYDWLKVAPYQAKFSNEDHGWKTSKGLRVMAIAYELDYKVSPFTCIAAPHGVITEYFRLPHLLNRKNYGRPIEQQQKEATLIDVRNFIYMHKPHLIVIGGESRDALMIRHDIKNVISDLVQSKGFPSIEVEIIDNEFAKVYANSKQGKSDFPRFPELLLQAVSLARKMQDPLIEYAQLCNYEDEILSLEYHPLQNEITQEVLLENLHLEFINRTNEVGVDINEAIKYPNSSKLLQFLGGLGPRKAKALLKAMTNKKFETRTELTTLCHIGPKIFINCSGFIKIATDSLNDDTRTGGNPLECTRIHPESYDWAKKMAVDALENDNDEGLNPNYAVVQIFNSPEQLDELDLDLYAEELERNGFGCKNVTVYDIRAEFHSPYKDSRFPYVSPNSEELFVMLTKLPLYVGKLITGIVTEVLFVKPNSYQTKKFIPRRNGWNNCWSCVFCKDDTFVELEDVSKHFKLGKCPGKAKIVKLHFDCGISGNIFINNFSDSFVKNLQDCVAIGELLTCRILTIDKEKFSVNCTLKRSDMIDEDNKFKPKNDSYYDYDDQRDEKSKNRKEIYSNNKHKIPYTRGCIHPNFKNISFSEAEQYLAGVPPGEIIIRPSSRRPNYIIFTWKVADNIYQHIDVLEEGKINNYMIGSTLRIHDQQFEALDEIIMMHINPMVSFSRDLLYFKYYRDTNGGMKDKMEELLNNENKKNSSKIHYFVSASKNYPGNFLLSYLPGDKCKHEYITVTPKGYQFRQQLFNSIDLLFNWFKLHFNDITPIVTSPTASYSVPRASYQNANEDLSGTKREILSTITNQAHSYSSMPSSSHNTPSAKTPYRTPVELPTLNYGQTGETVAIPFSRRTSPAHSTPTLPSPSQSFESFWYSAEMDREYKIEKW